MFFFHIHEHCNVCLWFMLLDSRCPCVSAVCELDDVNQFFGFFMFLLGKLGFMFWETHTSAPHGLWV